MIHVVLLQVTVILENLFEPNQFYEDPNLRGDLEADIVSECNKFGPVEKVRPFITRPHQCFQGSQYTLQCLRRGPG